MIEAIIYDRTRSTGQLVGEHIRMFHNRDEAIGYCTRQSNQWRDITFEQLRVYEDDDPTGMEKMFRQLCKYHDLTYMMSDDNRAYKSGLRSRDRITAYAKRLPADVAKRIWNDVVAEKMRPEYAEQFQWK